MAVFTQVDDQAAKDLLESYDIGSFESLNAISAGIENTNYFLETREEGGGLKRWVLTLFENIAPAELPYFCALTRHLEKDGFRVPAPVTMTSGKDIFQIQQKHGVIVPCLRGRALKNVGEHECAALGHWVARMHLSLRDFKSKRPLVRDLDWMINQTTPLGTVMPTEDYEELRSAIARYASRQDIMAECPQGTVHGDLFHDNVLFEEGGISGVIDFYNACDATLLYDLAVAANDWTVDAQGNRDYASLSAMVSAYQSVREWTPVEREVWPSLLELAALRFWISRLVSYYSSGYQADALSGNALKDPKEMQRILRHSMA